MNGKASFISSLAISLVSTLILLIYFGLLKSFGIDVLQPPLFPVLVILIALGGYLTAGLLLRKYHKRRTPGSPSSAIVPLCSALLLSLVLVSCALYDLISTMVIQMYLLSLLFVVPFLFGVAGLVFAILLIKKSLPKKRKK